MTCTFPGRDKPVHAKKLCNSHWRRLLRNGDLDLHHSRQGSHRPKTDWANLPADDPRHGRPWTYNGGCRCDRCRKAKREYIKEYMREYNRNYYRALAALRNRHDPEFRGIHAEQKASV